jgi:alkanesulfonate monooxygenase SsuD/methylene tetrahydromethanopterin reductase-like flavin-dependent oxidoreductase (luciferase family)
LAALDVLSDGRVVTGVGPGSSPEDYALVGLTFEERWPRFDEAVRLLKSLLHRNAEPFSGSFYPSPSAPLEPHSVQEPGVPIWIGSWGSNVGLRRVARLGDGWLASAYNVTPASVADALSRLREHLRAVGKDPEQFPHALGTMFCYLTDDRQVAEETLHEVASALNRPAHQLRDQLLIGPPGACLEKLDSLVEAGVRRVFLWPVADELVQLTRLQEMVVSRVST